MLGVDATIADAYLLSAMADAGEDADPTFDVDLVAAQFNVLDSDTHRRALLEAIRARDAYRKLLEDLKDENEKLKLGLIGPKSERFKAEDDAQLSLQVLAELLGRESSEGADAQALAEDLLAQAEQDAAKACDEGDGGADSSRQDVYTKPHRPPRKPTGRRTAREEVVHKVTVERLPEEVQRLGLDAFERIGEERMTTVERRTSALFEVTVVRPKFRAKTEKAVQAVKEREPGAGRCPRRSRGAGSPWRPRPSFPRRARWQGRDCSPT